MNCTISVSKDGKYIIQKVVGEITSEKSIEYNIESHKKGKELGINKYLVDFTEAKNIDSVFKNYQFAYTLMRDIPEIDQSALVATVLKPGDRSHDFMKVLIQNSGLNGQLFTDIEQAIEFLENNDA